MGVPVLGICYGQQAMVTQLGGRVEPSNKREFGRAEIEVTGQSPLVDGVWALGARDDVWMSHGDRVTAAAAGLSCARHERQRAVRDHRGREAALLCRDVPSRSRAHAARGCAPAQLHAERGRHRAHLEHEGVPRRSRAPHPRAGGPGPRHLRPVGRRRFIGRRASDPRSDRRSAHLHLRRHRTDARGRGG